MTVSMQPFALDDAARVDFAMLPLDDDLRDLVNTFFVLSTDEERIDDFMPAYSAQLMVYAEGRSVMTDHAGNAFRSKTITSTAPLLTAMPLSLRGPVRIIGASLTPLGWQVLSALPADEVNNCTVEPRKLLDENELNSLESLAEQFSAGKVDAQTICDCIGQSLRRRRDRINPRHARFVETVIGWLASAPNPPVQDLYDTVDQSKRNVQRLCRRFFGVSPSHLLKRYRAIRAAMLFANPDIPQSMRDEIQMAYFDQAHLIRDIRRYTGQTPRALRSSPVAAETLDPKAHGKGAELLQFPSGKE